MDPPSFPTAPNPPTPHWRLEPRARKAFNLVSRLRSDADQVLRLLDNTAVPFKNNNAEPCAW